MKRAYTINFVWIGLFLAILLVSGLSIAPVAVWAGITPTPTSPATDTPVPATDTPVPATDTPVPATNTPTSGGGGGGGGGSQPTATPVPSVEATPTETGPGTLPETGNNAPASPIIPAALAGLLIVFLVGASVKQLVKRGLR